MVKYSRKDTRLNVYWAEPTIVTQGTQNGLFQTSHDTHINNIPSSIYETNLNRLTKLKQNPLYNRMYMIMK